jgi:hypothetical protein
VGEGACALLPSTRAPRELRDRERNAVRIDDVSITGAGDPEEVAMPAPPMKALASVELTFSAVLGREALK